MGFSKSLFSHAGKYVPSRRSVLCGLTAVTLLAGPIGLATANAVSTTAAAASAPPSKSATVAVDVKAETAANPAKPAGAPKAPPRVQPAARAAASAAKAAPAGAAAPVAKAAAPAAKPAPAAKAAVAAQPADPYASVTLGQLERSGLYGSQEHFSPSSEQWQNAKAIVQVTRQRGMSPYAAVIAVSVAMQESSLHNLTSAVDADSLGLFQQRPSMGWGSRSQLTDPAYATTAFLKALTQYAPGYDSMPLWQAAQNTQRSGYPTAYARWEDQAAHMVQQITAG